MFYIGLHFGLGYRLTETVIIAPQAATAAAVALHVTGQGGRAAYRL